jgi:hypothetical protein
LLNHYPESGHNSNTLGRLAFDWFDLLSEEEVTQRQFSAGVRHSVKTCRFFPKVADILEGVAKYRANPPTLQATDSLQIADTSSRHDLTPEEIARNKERVAHITAMLSRKITMDDAVKAVESATIIKEFGN